VHPGLDTGYNRIDAWTVQIRLTVSFRFTMMSPGGLTIERLIMAKQQRWCPGNHREKLALVLLLLRPGYFNSIKTTGANSRWLPVQHGLSWFSAVLPGVATVLVPDVPGIQTGTHRGCIPRQCELGFILITSAAPVIIYTKYETGDIVFVHYNGVISIKLTHFISINWVYLFNIEIKMYSK